MSSPVLKIRTTPLSTFQLLKPGIQPVAPDAFSIELLGHPWILTEPLTSKVIGIPDEFKDAPAETKDPAGYMCISYAWGQGRTANPFYESHKMSDRAIPVIEATIKAKPVIEAIIKELNPEDKKLNIEEIWQDAFCVPYQDENKKAACLRSMGNIYKEASLVVVVLSKPCTVILEQIQSEGRIDKDTLEVLENDDWVSRAWTYQEIANSYTILFIAEGGSDVVVKGSQLFNCIGQALKETGKETGFNQQELRSRYPRLNTFEDVMADWIMAGALNRSVYQIMAAMEEREAENPDDRFNTIIGAISDAPLEGVAPGRIHPAEYFMQICENKNDFSFIYSTSPRSNERGKSWRPVEGPLHVILAWHSSGEKQPGQLFPTHLQLDDVCPMFAGQLEPSARKFLEDWLKSGKMATSTDDMPARILQRLKTDGFSGCGEHLELPSGYFFPQDSFKDSKGVFAVVSTQLEFVFGAPGLLLKENGSNLYRYCSAGVFVGPAPKVGSSVNIE